MTLTVSPKRLTFPSQIFGTIGVTSKFKKVTLSNKSKTAVALLGFAAGGDFAINSKDSTCGSSLASGATCVVAVTFTPTAVGPRSGQLNIANGAGNPLTVTLKGTGALGALKISPRALSFTKQALGTTSATQKVTISNLNPVPLSITALASEGDFIIPSRTCGSALAGGASCTITVAFAPVDAGSRKGKLEIGARAKHAPQIISLKGVGTFGSCTSNKPDSCSGICTDFLTDKNNCGGCGNVCPTTCAQGQCQSATVACGIDTPDFCTCGSATECVNRRGDPNNCGQCGQVCLIGQICEDGRCTGCTSSSAPDQCGAACTNFESDPHNCGACGKACPSGLCSDGQCLACDVSAPNLCSGQCTNLSTDASNCGGCGNVCPAGEACQQGQCAGIACAADTPNQCGGKCANVMTDPNNCGACGTVCPGGSCVEGQCVNCAAGTPDQCGSLCTDLSTDSSNCGGCGNLCPSGSTCSGGRCVGLACSQIATSKTAASTTLVSLSAGPAETCGPDKPNLCGGECVNVQTDPFNCGSCGNYCASGPCVTGNCLNCSGDTSNICGTACVDLFTDPKNCGSCGNVCAGGESCVGGICQNPTICNGAITNTNIDTKNCGGCGNVCRPAVPCVKGQCVNPIAVCPGKLRYAAVCDGICVDLATDSSNCGTCGKVCAGNLVCNPDITTPGRVISPPGCTSCSGWPPDDCSGLCTWILNDSRNCGSCGNVCPTDQICQLGKCASCGNGLKPDHCDDTCTDVQIDSANCGACGNSCGGGAFCDKGACVQCSASAPTQCPVFGTFQGNQCTNTQSDSDNCGACGNQCGKGQQCVSGKCRECGSFETQTSNLAPQVASGSGARSPLDALASCTACNDPTPNACGTQCVNKLTDSNNCGGCGNVCSLGSSCIEGKCTAGPAPTPSLCGAYLVEEWGGLVTETATTLCGGSASLSLDTSVASTLQLAPSATTPGGCDVTGTLNLVQNGALCGLWGGPWMCGGTVDAAGNMSLDCTCNTDMAVSGSFQANSYSGTWSFFASGTDANGDSLSDTAAGTFGLGLTSSGAALAPSAPRRSSPMGLRSRR